MLQGLNNQTITTSMLKVSFLDFHSKITGESSFKPSPQLTSFRSTNTMQSFPFNAKTFQPNTGEMKKMFDKYDANKDGKISREEYKAALRMVSKGKVEDGEVAKAFEVADTDGDGFIDFNEFMGVHSVGGGVKISEIQNAFCLFDLNGDGKISARELMKVMRKMGEACSLQACQKMVKAVDGDGDGLIDLDEFTTMMTRTMKLA